MVSTAATAQCGQVRTDSRSGREVMGRRPYLSSRAPTKRQATASNWLPRVNDEADVTSQRVVQRTTGLIGRLRVPVDTLDTRRGCARVDAFDECASDALAAERILGEKILQIADGFKLRGAAMKEIVGYTGKLTIVHGNQRMNRFDGIEESSPGGGGNVLAKRSHAEPTVKGIVTIPERTPESVIVTLNRSDSEVGHRLR